MVAARGRGTTHKEARESSSLVIARAAKQSRVFPGSISALLRCARTESVWSDSLNLSRVPAAVWHA